jgi:hypothetical protein
MQHAWNSIFWKIFEASDLQCINDIILHSGNVPLKLDIDVRRFSFLYKLNSRVNVVSNKNWGDGRTPTSKTDDLFMEVYDF